MPPAPAPVRTFLSGPAGLSTQGSVTLASGSLAVLSASLVAFDPEVPAAMRTIATGGQYLEVAWLYDSRIDTTARTQSGFHLRYVFFARGNNLFKLDHRGISLPQATPWSNITLAQLCDYFPTIMDYEPMVERSALAFRAPGPDGTCNTADDNYRLLRAGMGPTEAAPTIAQPLLAIKDTTTQATTGWLLRSGAQLLRADADFQNTAPVNLPAGATFEIVAPLRAWGVAQQHALIRVNNELRTLNLADFTLGPVLRSLPFTPGLSFWGSDGTHGYIAVLESGGTTFSVQRVALANPAALETLATDATSPNVLTPRFVRQAADRFVYERPVPMTQTAVVRSVPKAGGAPITLYTTPADTSVENLAWVGSTLFANIVEPSGPVILALDPAGGAPSPVTAGVMAGFVFREPAAFDEPPRFVTALVPPPGATNFGASALRQIDGNTRTVSVSYGTLPSGAFQDIGIDPAVSQAGQHNVVLAVANFGMQFAVDLFALRNDRAGLTRVTSNIAATATAVEGSSVNAWPVRSPRRNAPRFGPAPMFDETSRATLRSALH